MNTWSDNTLDWWVHGGNYLGPIIAAVGAILGIICVYIAINSADEISLRRERAAPAIQKDLQKQVDIAKADAAKAKSRTDKRQLSEAEREAFVKSIGGFHGQTVFVYYDARDPEAADLAGVLSAALKTAGIGSGDTSPIDFSGLPEGVVVYTADLSSPSQTATSLLAALRTASFEATLSAAPSWAVVSNPGWAGLMVGVKPRD